MPYTKSGSFFCPCCGTRINIDYKDSGFITVDIDGFVISKYYEEEESPEGSGDVRPSVVSEELHENLHGQAEGNGPTKAKFDRNGYQRELMRKRRAEARKPKG